MNFFLDRMTLKTKALRSFRNVRHYMPNDTAWHPRKNWSRKLHRCENLKCLSGRKWLICL